MADDRDVRKPKTPPAGIRAQTAGEQTWEGDETPVDGDPVSQINTRARNAAANSRQAVTKLVETNSKIDRYQATVETYMKDHERIYDRLKAQDNQLSNIHGSVNMLGGAVTDLSSTVGTLKGSMASASEQLQTLSEHLEREYQLRQQEKLAETEIAKEAALAQTEITKEEALAKIGINAKHEITSIEVKQKREFAHIDDSLDAKKAARRLRLKTKAIQASIIAGIVALLEVLRELLL